MKEALSLRRKTKSELVSTSLEKPLKVCKTARNALKCASAMLHSARAVLEWCSATSAT
ncbi:MAG: hypothetical protein M3256_15800 [Actinomycetota bacterium]|nr:hypothetical protein [Actinomycetota bacterium]